ncbi:MAG: hypothetical protein ACK5LX_00590 [Oscillospiraceae bacterium]
MVDKKYPAIAQMMVEQRNGSYYQDACVKDTDYSAAFDRIMGFNEQLTQLFMKQNPSKADAEQFKRYLCCLDNDGYTDMLGTAVDYSYVDGFITASKLFLEINKASERGL